MSQHNDILFEKMLEFEREHYQFSGQSITGKKFLKSELLWLSSFFKENLIDDDPLGQIKEFGGRQWLELLSFLYKQPKMDESGMQKGLALSIQFLDWLSEGTDELQHAIEILKSGKKEIDRLFKIDRNLKKIVQCKVFMPAPTDDPELFEWSDGLNEETSLQVMSEESDIFKVHSKNRKNKITYLTGQESGKAVVMKTDGKLLTLLQPGDRLPLNLGKCADGASILINYDRPIYDSKAP